jgi:hypothetical protein
MLTGHPAYRDLMAFEVTLIDESTELVDGADSYQQEGPLTTFYGGDRPRPMDSWSVKVASYRTDRISRIRRHGEVSPVRPYLELTGTDG